MTFFRSSSSSSSSSSSYELRCLAGDERICEYELYLQLVNPACDMIRVQKQYDDRNQPKLLHSYCVVVVIVQLIR